MFILGNVSMWFNKSIRIFFFWIDRIIYNFIPMVYDLLISIARTSVLSQGDISSMAERIYKLLAVFMVFKVTFSLIMYVVNPDDFSEKTKGVGKLTSNIIISLALLILTPYFFRMAYSLQTILLEDNSIATLIFGSSANESFLTTAGDDMAYITMSPFFTPNLGITELYECSELMEEQSDHSIHANTDCTGIDYDYEDLGDDNSMRSLVNTNFEEDTLKTYVAGLESRSFALMFRQDIATATTEANDVFIMDYKFIISTAVGVVILLLLITFCMDVALRSIKLAFLQLVAPIPIISYIDPKSGKDGLFKKWYQMCFKTFLSLFVRLLGLYFAVYIISKVADMKLIDVIDGSYVSNALISILIIVGALMFAKQLPKILEGLGIKLDGDGKFFLNPFKKLEEETIGGKRITGAAGAMVAGAADRAARFATAAGAKGKLKALAGAGPGILGSAARGFSSNSGFKGGLNTQAGINRRLREGRIKGLSPIASYLDYAGSHFGLDDATLEQEGTFIQRSKDAITEANALIANQTRANEMEIAKEQRRVKPLKSVESRRKAVKSAGDKLKESAESFASKKADVAKTALQQQQLEVISRAKSHGVDALNAADKAVLAGMGINTSTMTNPAAISAREVAIAKKEREISQNQYTTNRRTDTANVEFLTNNQGNVLDHALVVGEGSSQEIFEAGTFIDGSVVARAQTAQGKYIKDSQKAVFNELSKKTGSAYEVQAKDDFDAFQRDYEVYEEAKTTANKEAVEYNANSTEDPNRVVINNVDVSGSDNFDSVDKTIKNVENGADTVAITGKLNASDSTIETLTGTNERIKADAKVVYYDEYGRKKEISLSEAESLLKPREEEHKRKVSQHQERRTLLQNIANKK